MSPTETQIHSYKAKVVKNERETPACRDFLMSKLSSLTEILSVSRLSPTFIQEHCLQLYSRNRTPLDKHKLQEAGWVVQSDRGGKKEKGG